MAVELIGAITGAGSFLLQLIGQSSIGRPFKYLYNYKTNFDNLQGEVNRLKDAKVRVERNVDAAHRDVEEINQSVKDWQTKVINTITEAERFIGEKEENPRCFKGLLPNCITGYKHSKKAFKLKRDDIGALLLQEEKFDSVSYPTLPLENFDKLQYDVLRLRNARLKVERKVEEAKNNEEEIEEDVKKWLEDVDSIIFKAEELIKNQSSIGTDRKTRYQNSRAASELMADNIGPLLQQEERFGKVSHPTIHKELWLIYNEDYLAFESRNTTEKNVWEALKDEKIYMMGVYGMGGLGKTTLVQEIGRQAEKDKLFDQIVFVEVTETPDTIKIQTSIAKKLGLRFNDGSERASKLYSRMKDKNILLIMDNIWEELDLKTVGIPFKADCGRSKILMTTRNVDVLEKMGSANNFRIGILNEEEAWSLFQKIAGGVIHKCELNSLPQDVCKECGGLPIVIRVVAKALRNKSRPFYWERVLEELRAPSPTKIMGTLEDTYKHIALSYKYLRNDELRKTFLISSLMKNNTSISSLLKHVVNLDVLERNNLTMEEARNGLEQVVNELKDSCLLFNGFESRQFAMHDVVRAVAITIAYRDYHVFTERNDIEREWKDKYKLKKCTKISLPGSSTVISKLWPTYLNCPNLEYFYMTNMWESSHEIPEDFFTVMPKLKVLNLFGMQKSSLPSSLDLLTNLRTLCLDDGKIQDVAIIGKLKKLEILSLKNSNIEELPIEMGQLTQLRLLDLSNCGQLEVISPNVISKLSQLEELFIKGCPIQWKVEVLEELNGLSDLTNLELDIKDNKMLPKGFFSKELRRYKISIGDWPFRCLRINEDKSLRMLEFIFNSTICLEEIQGIKNVEILVLAADVENSLEELQSNITPLFNEKLNSDLQKMELEDKIWHDVSENIPFELQRFENLKELKLSFCDKYKKLFFPNLPYLEVLDVSCCYKLMSLVPSPASFQNLKVLNVSSCNRLMKKLITPSMARVLVQLREMSICDCRMVKEIVENEGDATTAEIVFDNLNKLSLTYLESLTCFCSGNYSFNFPSLEDLIIWNCPNMKTFSKGILSTPKLHKIDYEREETDLESRGSELNATIQQAHKKKVDSNSKEMTLTLSGRDTKSNWQAMFQENSILQNLDLLEVQDCQNLTTLFPSLASFENLRTLRVRYCNGMQNLMSSSIAKSLVRLEVLLIGGCKMMIEVLANEGNIEKDEIFFEKLKELYLYNLESLTCFCSEDYTLYFPFLERLYVSKCSKLKPFSRGGLSMPRLQELNWRDSSMSDFYTITRQLQNVHSQFQTSHIDHARPLPFVPHNPFKIVDGPTCSTADNLDEIAKLFPNLFAMIGEISAK